MRQRIVLYGTGLEGERFFWKYHDRVEIEYCIDRNCHRDFHGIWVYGVEEVRDVLKKSFVIIAAVDEAYSAIEEILTGLGMREFENYLGAYLVERKLAILYGNCHMIVLKQYFVNNPWFTREYAVRRYHVCDKDRPYPSKEELLHCRLLIGQDIREDNSLGVPSMDALMEMTPEDCRCIRIPNIYKYNLFWPQIGDGINYRSRHINKSAIDMDRYSDEQKKTIRRIVDWLGELGDVNIERMYREGMDSKDIAACIRGGEIYPAEDIKKNFEVQMNKIKEREQLCDIRISDYIEQNYQAKQLFLEPCHPTELLICEKGRRILQLIGIPQDETIPVGRHLDQNEIFIYGCVRRALGITYEQNFIRRSEKMTLMHCPIDLDGYVEEYIAWVCEEE